MNFFSFLITMVLSVLMISPGATAQETLARTNGDEVILNEGLALNALTEVGTRFIGDFRNVSFGAPFTERISDRTYLMMRGKDQENNCNLVYIRLDSRGTEFQRRPRSGGTCTGAPCNSCSLVNLNDGAEACVCLGTGNGTDPGFCNHSTGG